MRKKGVVVVAYAVGRVTGNHGAIPWMGQMRADMRWVHNLTINQAVIMGLKTFHSIGKPLPDRQNIVLTSKDFATDGVDVAHSLDEALAMVKPGRTPFIFGGTSVYAQTLEQDLVDIIYVTEIHAEFPGDTFFPEISADKWQEVEREDLPADDENAYTYSFVKYERKNV